MTNLSMFSARCPRDAVLRVTRAVVPLVATLFLAGGIASGHAIGALQVMVIASPPTPRAGQVVSFAARVAKAPPGSQLRYAWSFGDGTTIVDDPATSHTYSAVGDYVVAVSVVATGGSAGATAVVASVVVHVRHPRAGSCVVPSLRHKSLTGARRALRRAHCTLGRYTRRNASAVPKGSYTRMLWMDLRKKAAYLPG